MRFENGTWTYSPSDLITFLESDYVSWMDRLYSEDKTAVEPDRESGLIATIHAEGVSHEARFIDELRLSGREVVDLAKGTLAATVGATHSAREVIYQARLELRPFAGFPDFLVRMDGPSNLGNYHYEIWDTKLSRETKPYFLVQLCCYAEMLEALQGSRPEYVSVVLGTKERRSFRTEDFYYFYLNLKRAFLEMQKNFSRETRPDVLSKQDFGRWKSEAEKWLEVTDHLCRVANITNSQILKLRNADIQTLTALAVADDSSPRGMAPKTYERLRAQAQLQKASADKERPARFNRTFAIFCFGAVRDSRDAKGAPLSTKMRQIQRLRSLPRFVACGIRHCVFKVLQGQVRRIPLREPSLHFSSVGSASESRPIATRPS